MSSQLVFFNDIIMHFNVSWLPCDGFEASIDKFEVRIDDDMPVQTKDFELMLAVNNTAVAANPVVSVTAINSCGHESETIFAMASLGKYV